MKSQSRIMVFCALSLVAWAPTMIFGGQPSPPRDKTSPAAENLALGKKYAVFPAPNYHLCTDPGDAVQLTDGTTTDQHFWTQQGTVGWQSARYITMTVDLGRVEPISGAAFRTAAGAAEVQWPAEIHVLTSADGAGFRDAGDLVALDHKVHGPWPTGYAIRRLATSELRTRGRFVRFLVLPAPGSPYTFCDEVEVHRGPAELLQGEPGGKPVAEPEQLFLDGRVRSSVRRRWDADLAAVRQAIEKSGLADDSVRKTLARQCDEAATAIRAASITPDASFRAVLPVGHAHAQVFRVQAALWKAMGRGDVTVWTPPPWDPLDPFAAPPASPSGRIEVHVMRGEYRAAAVNLANATDQPIELRLRFEGLPGAPAPDYLTVHDVPWTDTVEGRPVAAALPLARRDDKGWSLTVLPGLPAQAWLTFHVVGRTAGDNAGSLVIEGPASQSRRLPARLRVYPLDFPQRTSLWLGGWSYTDGKGSYGITPQNRQDFIRDLQQHFVNAPWATSSVMMTCEFAADGTVKLDTRRMDEWLDQWREARAYCVFLAVGGRPEFGGATLGTPEFNRRVANWISAWVRHLGRRAVRPEQLILLIDDEPHEGTDVGPLVAWARAIRAAEPRVRIWEDPTYADPAKAPRELFEACDVLCPNRPMWLAGGEPFARFYLAQQRQGRTLNFYSCSGPARLLDPYAYYRLQAWHCWQVGAIGSFYWAFGDNSGASSWNEYLAQAGPFTPLFLDQTTVTAGKQMEAIREGVEDYEYLVMLRRAAESARAAGRKDAALQWAETLVKTAADDVLSAPETKQLRWHEPKDRSRADAMRVRILEALTGLTAK